MSSRVVVSSVKDGVRTVTLNKPSKKNAFCLGMYRELTEILTSDALDDSVVVTVLTGAGDYYSSGNELAAGGSSDPQSLEEAIEGRKQMMRDFFDAFIDYPKLLVAVVNGPAIGVAVTTLALCDVVYASDRATFSTPFVNLGLCPEGCSSFLFPRIMGRSRASELLLLGRKLSAREAQQCGLVSRVVLHEEMSALMQQLQALGKLPVVSVKRGKRLITKNLRAALHRANDLELSELWECYTSKEFATAIAKFLATRNKL